MKKQAIGLVLVMASGYPNLSQALSLGDIQFNSRLNEPFKARIELLQASEQELEKLQVHVAPPSIFAQARLQRPKFIDSLQFSHSSKQGKNYLIITSPQPIDESEFSLLLEVTSPKGDLLKRYSVALEADQAPSPTVAPESSNGTQTITESTKGMAVTAEQATQPELDLAKQTEQSLSTPAIVDQTNASLAQTIENTGQALESSLDQPLNLDIASDINITPTEVEVAPQAEEQTTVAVVPQAQEQPPAVAVASQAEEQPLAIEAPAQALMVPVNLPFERSKRASAATPQVAIPLPNLAFKHRYKVRKADTIFTIAERLKIGSLNLDEKALTLYANNPKAFVKGDITRLKVGAVLKTPSVVGKRRLADPTPILAKQEAPAERPVQVVRQKSTPKTQQKVQQVVAGTSSNLASVAVALDPPLARAVYENKLTSELKLTDLQERLNQAQQLLEARTKETNDLKDLVQEKNRLLARREGELASLQTQVAQQTSQPPSLIAKGAAGPLGKADTSVTGSVPQPVLAENTWQGVFASPLVWKMTALSSLFLILVALWQKRRSADQLMQLNVQNAILMPDDYVNEEEDENEGGLLDFLWGEHELEQAREQLQNLRHSMASLREQSQRLQAYLHPEPMGAAI